MALHAVTRDRRAMAALKTLVALDTLLSLYLFGQDYFGWWDDPFPAAVDAAMVGLLTAVSLLLFWFLALLGFLYFSSQSRRPSLTVQTPSRKMRVALGAVPYGLTALWGWAYQTGGDTKWWGGLAVAFLLCYSVSNFVLMTSEKLSERRRKRAEALADGAAGTAPRKSKTAVRRRAVAPRVAHFLWRQWWHLTHPGYLKRMSVIDRSLYVAVVRGNAQNVAAFLKRGANPNLRLVYSQTLLCCAATRGNAEIVHLLLEKGGDANVCNPHTGYTPLLAAARDGSIAVARLLLECGASVDARERSGTAALGLAARHGHAEMVGLLLSHGAAIDGRSRKNITALMVAASLGHAEVVRILLASGADAELESVTGTDALGYARRKAHQDVVALLEAHQTE